MQNNTSISSSSTAMITGASRCVGLGFAVARQLAEQDFHVILAAREQNQAEVLADELRAEGLQASALRLDLADSASIADAAERLAGMIDHLDVLINNASAMPDFGSRSALEMDFDALRSIFEVTLFGCCALTQALLPLLKRASAARIVNVSSAAARHIADPQPGPLFSPAYSLAKYTLNAWTATTAAALSDTRILVNAVDPGSVATHPERGEDENDRSPAEAAKGVVWAATLTSDGPTGGLFYDGEPVAGASR
ncbi:putative short chain oxidoreductase [Acidisarcina polymorpha]|uniref:Putative short chain oxidoreductase n=1 Tax=Acidisarcina polymorpha TaxID=2211140 RepID=A0A2Z5FT94_9BACT|nr:SDR family NAD(P)-dependent oxidoreductase [Acidisarcina polymorpha]AXC09932.1 putative short chain oxidoreductase [Acidisarcina polymorpha]